ncbi:MAG: DEAD/DEAH box helicase family protein, partial [Rhodopirellula sp.]|nr:DEAD/DEAH box helicase family protein [Rhodopirellula sp.]
MDKKSLSEQDIRTKYITPAMEQAGWDLMTQIREEVFFTKGRIIVRGRKVSRGKPKFADYVLYYRPNIPIAVIEAKDNNHSIGDGMQQGLDYAESLQVPFVFSSNGDGFLFHDNTAVKLGGELERQLTMNEFPSPDELWTRYCQWKGLEDDSRSIVEQDYFSDGGSKSPRYYQLNAINRTIEAVARGQDRALLVMATGTGKTYTAFQIIWRLWKSRQKKRILFLADRNILVDQTRTNDFKPFGSAMTKISKRQIDKSFEIYLALYQAVTGNEEDRNIYKQFSPDFFDLIVVDECHRGSAAADSAWREILDYFSDATQIGLTATPKETKEVSNIDYFGKPIYTYSLKQGIDDGFLAPYKVHRIDFDKDVEGWRPTAGQKDSRGHEIEDRIYNQKDMDRKLVLDQRTELVAKKVTEFLRATDPYLKTIVFCDDIDHAERMRQALVRANPAECAANRRYVMRITGDEQVGKAELDN